MTKRGLNIIQIFKNLIVKDFLVVPQHDGYGLLVTLQADVIKTYQLEKMS